jgi:hypothetical protein
VADPDALVRHLLQAAGLTALDEGEVLAFVAVYPALRAQLDAFHRPEWAAEDPAPVFSPLEGTGA